MRSALLLATAGIVLAANGWGLRQYLGNRSEPRGGTFELTERELHLQDIALESTVCVLRFKWNVLRTGDREDGPVIWLNTAKLTELGFDCGLPLTSPNARNHYSSMPARAVFLALEYEGEVWRKAGATSKGDSHLWIVDAARDPLQLRARYPDEQRCVIARGLVRLVFRDRENDDRPGLRTPRLEGWIEGITPDAVFVPLAHSRALRAFRRTSAEGPEARQPSESRFAVRLCWGANYEPLVEGIRLLPTSGGMVR